MTLFGRRLPVFRWFHHIGRISWLITGFSMKGRRIIWRRWTRRWRELRQWLIARTSIMTWWARCWLSIQNWLKACKVSKSILQRQSNPEPTVPKRYKSHSPAVQPVYPSNKTFLSSQKPNNKQSTKSLNNSSLISRSNSTSAYLHAFWNIWSILKETITFVE